MKKFLSIVVSLVLLLVWLPASASVISTVLITAGIEAGKMALLAILAALLGLSAAVLGTVMVYRFLHRERRIAEVGSGVEGVVDIDAVDVHEIDGDAISVDASEVFRESGSFYTCGHCGMTWGDQELVNEGTRVDGGWFWGCPGCLEWNDGDDPDAEIVAPDAGDFELACTECGALFTAGENVSADGEHVVCPECGASSVDGDDDVLTADAAELAIALEDGHFEVVDEEAERWAAHDAAVASGEIEIDLSYPLPGSMPGSEWKE